MGYGTLPRAAQIKNVVIELHDVETREGLFFSEQPLYSHAYLPRAKFDDTSKDGSWFFTRKDGAVLNNGVEVPLENYGRYDNPWSQTTFPADDITFTYGDSSLRLNLHSETREVSENLH